MSTIQRHRSECGLKVPNFKFYFWSFVLRPLATWFNSNASVSWRPVEEKPTFPHRLQDLVHSAIPLKRLKLRLGPIIYFPLTVWRSAEKISKSVQKWHLNSPIFNNFLLLTDNIPFSFPAWNDKGIHVFKDIYDDNGLHSFGDLCVTYDLPGSSFFLSLSWCTME